MRESVLERQLVRRVAQSGGLALKFVSPGMAGVPDRLILLPEGKIAFAEMKAPGKKPTSLQRLRHGQLRDLGFPVYVIDSKEKIGVMLNEICTA